MTVAKSDISVSAKNCSWTTSKQITQQGIIQPRTSTGVILRVSNANGAALKWVNVDLFLLHDRAVVEHSTSYDHSAYVSGAEVFTIACGTLAPGQEVERRLEYNSQFQKREGKGLGKLYYPLRVYGETTSGGKFMFDLASKPVPALSEKTKYCFIANAAFEDENHPTVRELRRVRDELLRPTRTGRAFIKFYYRHSPRIAKWMSSRPKVKMLARAALRPLARATKAASRLRRGASGSGPQHRL